MSIDGCQLGSFKLAEYIRVGLSDQFHEKVCHVILGQRQAKLRYAQASSKRILHKPVPKGGCRLPPYIHENIASRPICTIKHGMARTVLAWGTSWEVRGVVIFFRVLFFIALSSGSHLTHCQRPR